MKSAFLEAEDERIYLNIVPQLFKHAKKMGCKFDSTHKLWFTSPYNKHIEHLIKWHGINEATSSTALIPLKSLQENEIQKILSNPGYIPKETLDVYDLARIFCVSAEKARSIVKNNHLLNVHQRDGFFEIEKEAFVRLVQQKTVPPNRS